MRRKVVAMLRGAVATCSLIPIPVANSAANALVTPSMASLLLIVSGAAQHTFLITYKNDFNVYEERQHKNDSYTTV